MGVLGGPSDEGDAEEGRLAFATDAGLEAKNEELVGPIPLLCLTAIDHRIAEAADMPRRLPDLRVHDDRAVQPDHVVPTLDVVAPPGVLDVPLQLDAQRAVVPEPV